jgi:MFS family permease
MVKRAVFIVVFLASMIFLALFGKEFLAFKRPDVVAIDSPTLVFKASAPILYVVDSSRRRLIRIGASDTVDLIINANSSHFSEIYDLTANDAGEIFILDTVRDARSRRIKSEVVQRYSPDGRFMEEIFRTDHEIPSFDRKVAGLARNERDECSFVTLDSSYFTLHSLRPDVGKLDEKTYDFPMASKMFNHFDLGQGEILFFTTKRGEIYKTDDEGVVRIFTSGARLEGGDGAIPWDIAAGDDAKFYFTDLGRRGVYSIEADGESELVYDDPETIYYRISAQNGLTILSESEIVVLDRGEFPVLDIVRVDNTILAARIGAWITTGVFLTGCVWGLFMLARFLIQKNSFVIKFSAAVIVGTLFLTVVFCLIVTQNITDRMTREMLSHLTTTGELLAMQIPGDSFVRMDSVDDYMNEDYAAVKRPLEETLLSQEEYYRVYCVLYKIIDGAIAEVFESDNNHGIVNYPYDWPVEDSDEVEILNTGQKKTYTFPSWEDGGVIFSLCPIYGNGREPLGLIEIGADLRAFREENNSLILNLFLNVVSISIAMIILMIEFLVFLDARRKMAASVLRKATYVPVDMVRTVVFLVYFTTNMATSFLPLYARDMILAEGGFHRFPMAFLIAAPISADVLLGAFASLFGDRIIRKLGVRRMTILGGILAFAGICLEFAFYDIFLLTAGYALSGFGCGLTLFLANLKIAGESDSGDKEKGFASITAGTTSGINAGVVFGAFLINWLSQRMVLGVAALTSLTLVAISVKYMTRLDIPVLIRGKDNREISTARFLFSPRPLLYLLTLLGPAIASGYFLIYLFPIVAFDLGISGSNIGYSFLLHSLVVIFFSSSLTNFFSIKCGKPVSLTLWALVYAGSFMMFACFQNIQALLATLVLMGFADSFGQSLSANYYTELPEVVKYGYGRAIGLSNVVDNIAQTVGPFVFSYALHIGLREGLSHIALGLVVLSSIFLLNSFRSRNNP